MVSLIVIKPLTGSGLGVKFTSMPRTKQVGLTETQLKAIDLYVLDTYARKTKTHKSYIADKIGVKADTVQKWFLRSDEFKERLGSELARIKDDFNDLPLALRRTRIMRLSELYETIEDKRVDLKLKVLAHIREEVGDHKVQIQVEHTGGVSVNIPPRDDTYEQWLANNEKMNKAIKAEYEVV